MSGINQMEGKENRGRLSSQGEKRKINQTKNRNFKELRMRDQRDKRDH